MFKIIFIINSLIQLFLEEMHYVVFFFFFKDKVVIKIHGEYSSLKKI